MARTTARTNHAESEQDPQHAGGDGDGTGAAQPNWLMVAAITTSNIRPQPGAGPIDVVQVAAWSYPPTPSRPE